MERKGRVEHIDAKPSKMMTWEMEAERENSDGDNACFG